MVLLLSEKPPRGVEMGDHGGIMPAIVPKTTFMGTRDRSSGSG